MNRTMIIRFWLTIAIVAGLLAAVVVATPRTKAATPDDIGQAIDNGIAWLVSQQLGDGSWAGQVAHTGFAVTKLCDRAYELGYSPFHPEYAYSSNVVNGLNFIFANASFSGCGSGIVFIGDGHETYNTAIAMMAIAATRDPGRLVNVGNFVVDGKTYLQVVQENVDYFACAQNPDGAWRYWYLDELSDNSNTGYAVLGLRYAETFGCTIPASVKTGLDGWIDLIQDDVDGDPNDGASHYMVDWYWPNLLKTGNLLFEMDFVGDAPTAQRVQDAIDYIERFWNDPTADPGWRNNFQSMYCLMKGFESLQINFIEVDGNPVDWYNEFADAIIASQQPDGSWPWDVWGDPTLTTEWALLTLEKVAPPISLRLAPLSETNPVGTSHTVTATLKDVFGNPVSDVEITFTVTGANSATGTDVTDQNGMATFTYIGANKGDDVIVATGGGQTSNEAFKTWNGGAIPGVSGWGLIVSITALGGAAAFLLRRKVVLMGH